MATRELPTPNQIRQLLHYEPDTGRFFWVERGPEWFTHCTPGHEDRIRSAWNAAWSGKEAGLINGYGYRQINIQRRHIGGHRIAWCYVYGAWPNGQIDHINGVREDNRIANLRDVSHDANQRNMRLGRHNTSGVSGVHLCKITGRWRAEVRAFGTRHRLGRFPTLEGAQATVMEKRAELNICPRHGEPGRDYDAWRSRLIKPV